METNEIMVEATGVTQEAVFIGANQQTFVSDINRSENLVAYGASHLIALWKPLDPSHRGVLETLKGHEKEVTCVRFIDSTEFLVSCGEDSRIIVWKRGAEGYTLHQNIKYGDSSITCIAVLHREVFVTGNSSGYIALWVFDAASDSYVISHEFQVKASFYPLSLAMQDVDGNGGYVLAIGGTSSSLYIYSFVLEDGTVSSMKQACVLTGHEDWIKCLSFVSEARHSNIILASGSEDRYIRLWRLKLNELIDDSEQDESKLVLLTNKQYVFDVSEGTKASFCFEALLMGHDDWVTGLQWHPSNIRGTSDKKLQLLSSSADTALMLWEMDNESGIWCCFGRLGELSTKGASTATGSSGGFWSCLWFYGDDGEQYVSANGKTGSFRMYKSKASAEGSSEPFEPVLGITGPRREVTDVKWSTNGKYFMTTSIDQTTRLFAPWQANREHISWHEFARPQIHGYDMICLDNINSSLFVSGGDEKILRVFNLTQSTSDLLRRLGNINIEMQNTDTVLPDIASLPVLGLSNKGANDQIEAGDQVENEEGEVNDSRTNALSDLQIPPLEDHLQRYTLFPEVEKLYGHGYEITCCATNPKGTLIASACRSNTTKHAVIRIFSVQNDYQQCEQLLEGHKLTVTSIEFSPDGKYLVTVSRDRQFSLWSVDDELSGKFSLVEINPKAHSRIIWDCSWLPSSQESNHFLTASRDKQIKLWKVDSGVSMIASLKFSEPVTAVTCYTPVSGSDSVATAAVGLENGDIHIVKIDLKSKENILLMALSFDNRKTPDEKITKLAFSNIAINGRLQLASGSADTSARLYSVDKLVL